MTTPYAPTIRTQLDLQAVWRRLMGPGGFSGHSLWMMTIIDDRPVPRLLEVAECQELPSHEESEGFTEVLRILGAEEAGRARFAFLRSRPGPGRLCPDDLAWARFVLHACRTAGVGTETMHVATEDRVFPVPPDALVASA